MDGLQSGIGVLGSTNRFTDGDTACLQIYFRNVSSAEQKLTWLSNPDPLTVSAKGPDGAQVHVCLVIGLDRTDVPPVAGLFTLEWQGDSISPEIVGVDVELVAERG